MIKLQLGEGKDAIIVEVYDEIQASAFEKHGFKIIEDKK